MKIWKKLGCGFVMFGLLLVIGLWSTDTAYAIGKGFEINKDTNTATYTVTDAKKATVKFGDTFTTGDITVGDGLTNFTVKNDTDTVLQIGISVVAESPVVMTWSESSTGPLLISQTINSYTQPVFTGKLVYPGKSVTVDYYYDVRENSSVTKLPRLKVISYITPRSDVAVYDYTMKKAPKIEVTKMSADQVGIQVDVNNGDAGVRGVSKIYVYKGSKKIKTFTSSAKDLYTFTYKAKGAGSAKYKAKVVMKANKKDAKTSKEVSPVKNIWKQKVSKKLSDYESDDIELVIESLSYSGNTLVVKGYTVNTMGVDMAFPTFARAGYPGKQLFEYYTPTNKVIKKGIHKYTFKVKNVPVVDLRHCGITTV